MSDCLLGMALISVPLFCAGILGFIEGWQRRGEYEEREQRRRHRFVWEALPDHSLCRCAIVEEDLINGRTTIMSRGPEANGEIDFDGGGA